jgi:hypothetical protein
MWAAPGELLQYAYNSHILLSIFKATKITWFSVVLKQYGLAQKIVWASYNQVQ